MRKRTWLSIFIIAILTSLFIYAAGIAFAETVTVVVNGGNLSMTAGGNQTLNPVTLNGTDQNTTGSLGTLDVIDARGTGAGWNVVVSSTDFAKSGDPSKTIGAAGFDVSAPPAVTTVAGNTAPSSNSGTLSGGGLKLLSAALNEGMGNYQVTPSLQLSVPAQTYAGTYTATVTETVTSGP